MVGFPTQSEEQRPTGDHEAAEDRRGAGATLIQYHSQRQFAQRVGGDAHRTHQIELEQSECVVWCMDFRAGVVVEEVGSSGFSGRREVAGGDNVHAKEARLVGGRRVHTRRQRGGAVEGRRWCFSSHAAPLTVVVVSTRHIDAALAESARTLRAWSTSVLAAKTPALSSTGRMAVHPYAVPEQRITCRLARVNSAVRRAGVTALSGPEVISPAPIFLKEALFFSSCTTHRSSATTTTPWPGRARPSCACPLLCADLRRAPAVVAGFHDAGASCPPQYTTRDRGVVCNNASTEWGSGEGPQRSSHRDRF